MTDKAKIAVLGASGYTGSECARLLLCHLNVDDRRADRGPLAPGKRCATFSLSLRPTSCLRLVPDRSARLGPGNNFDLVFCALPHATTQKVIKDLLSLVPPHQGGRPFR